MFNKRLIVRLAISCVVLIILASVVMITFSAKSPTLFDRLYPMFIAIDIFGLLVVFLITIIDLFQVFRVYRLAGTRFLMRLLRSIAVLIVLPITLLYLFSLIALHSSVNSLFSIEVEEVIEDAISLSDKMLDVFYADAIEKTDQVFLDISKFDKNEVFANILDKLRSRYNAYEIAIFTSNNFVTYFSTAEVNKINPISLGDKALGQIKQGNYYINLESDESKTYIRVAKPFYQSPLRVVDDFVLQVVYPVPKELRLLGERIEFAKKDYQQQAYLRGPLQSIFLFNLSLILLLGLLFAIWVTVQVARRMSRPIFELTQATNRVSKGDYHTHVQSNSYDEFGQLANSFNYMTAQIADAQNKVISSHQKEESQRIYLDSLLEQLSSGVLIFHKNGYLIEFNKAAKILFDSNFKKTRRISLQKMIEKFDLAWPQLIQKHLNQSKWKDSLFAQTSDGFRHFVFRGRDLEAFNHELHHVVVFEDVTDLIHAQKQAAWVEVAKRLAHEIKNPLTPIQLAAERIRKKYAKSLSESDAKILNKSIKTIIEQVQSMKLMVQEFSEYARNVTVEFEYLNLNLLVQNVLLLYQGTDRKIMSNFSSTLPMVYISSENIRRLCINLLQNSIEATNSDDKIEVKTYLEKEDGSDYVVLAFEDTGIGISDGQVDKIFEPYFTSKPKGTGLGLAIVKKIVEEHGASIKIKSQKEKGTKITIKFLVG